MKVHTGAVFIKQGDNLISDPQKMTQMSTHNTQFHKSHRRSFNVDNSYKYWNKYFMTKTSKYRHTYLI